MAEKDLLLTQNVSVAGIEFSEKYVNIAKGGILSADVNGVPTVLAGGTDTHHLVRDDNEATGLKWVAIAGWTYRVVEAGTIRGVVAEIGDLVMVIVDRAGSGNADADFTVAQTNLDGAVIGPASVTDGYLVQFDGTTGKLIKAGSGVPGTMAYETATNYVAKTLFDANTLLFATSDDTPVALLGTELMPKIWAAVPADKIGTGYSGTAIAGQIAKDANWVYICETGGTATNQAWTRFPKATNWAN